MSDDAKKKADAPAGAPAEKSAKKEEPKGAGDHGDAKRKGGGAKGLLAKTPVLLVGAMIVEAAVLLAGFKMLGGAPKPSAGAELAAAEEPAAAAGEHGAASSEHGVATKEEAPAAEHGSEAASEHGGSGSAAPSTKIDKKKSVELQVLKLRGYNKKSGRTLFYDVSIYAVTKSENKERVEGTIKEREALIKDRVRTIIAQSDPEKLGGGSLEPGLETLRRQVKYQLDEIVGEGMIDEVLVPECNPLPTVY
jgi:flagellar basal body-associated protein FliL